MSPSPRPANSAGSSTAAWHVDAVCDHFERAWQAGQRPRIEEHLGDLHEPARSALFQELLRLELHYRRRLRETPAEEEYGRRFPEHTDLIGPVFREAEGLTMRPTPDLGSSAPLEDTGLESAGGAPPESPGRLGRYRITGLLGSGTFGIVYRAYDEDLQRDVAIKVPRRERVASPRDIREYLAEARVLASLEHPHIVPVHDFGRTDDGSCFVVSRFIEGSNLATRIEQARPAAAEAVEMVVALAEALHYAHGKGVVHRDIKPANILLDRAGKPYLADFGLALREEDFGTGTGLAGTPAYMSPEQARGEGHRVDGRSDLFSLGAVFYELLTGRRPFRGKTLTELREQVASVEPWPPRQLDDAIPKELERICLKALAKRATERYPTGRDLAEDLRHFLEEAATADPPRTPGRVAGAAAPPPPVMGPPTPLPVKIVPKGLRPFDAHDADFFLELLPGPRDRDGLPDSLRFWKARIEETDPDSTFAVGLLYGPSGCGKSSLVRAGLLPRLDGHVVAVYVEATASDTEARLLKGLRKHCPDLPTSRGLVEAVAALRRGRAPPAGQKVLIVLDQFEQWLHATKEEGQAELVQALRQCDGERVQALVLVRDDFWLAVSRFLKALEVEIVEGRNLALVDLFDPLHARKVLAAFGRAYGRLPDSPGRCSREQDAFLDQAVTGLAQDGKVISVRLALFAEMVKGRPWTPATLREVGGTKGVGVTFLEETFTAGTAPPQHRLHQKAAQAVLKALLPESGTDIKGHMRSQQELLNASGYASRPKDFDDLLRILDSEIRLLTPTDPEGKGDADRPALQGGAKYYQLTHDYLVPALRDWLTRKQKETRRGRAELLLADRAAVWNARPENRLLPSLWQWAQIRRWTAQKSWMLPQKKMMARAGRYHAVRTGLVAVLLAVAALTGLAIRDRVVEQQKATQAQGLVDGLLNAETAQVPGIVGQMADYRQWADPLLREENGRAAAQSRQKLHTSLALLPVDAGQVEYLYGRLLDAGPQEVPVLRDALAPHKGGLLPRLWAVVETPPRGKEAQRLRAAAALARYDPEGERWAEFGPSVVNDLVQENAVHLGQWSEAFWPVKDALVGPLSAIFRDRDLERAAERSLATNLLADYAADNLAVLADLLLDGDEKQFPALYPKFEGHGARGLPLLTAAIDTKLAAGLPSSDPRREALAKRQANAAVALLRLGQPAKVWPLLRRTPPDDPRVRSYLINRLSPLGADAGALLKRLGEEPDLTIRRALLLSLGEYGEEGLPAASRPAVLAKVQAMYRTEDDPGLHAAAEWLLRQWRQEAWLQQVNEEWAQDAEGRDRRLEKIQGLVKKDRDRAAPQWYVTGQGQTMVVIPGPVVFDMGSPEKEAAREDTEVQHRRRIGRTFALAAQSVTVEQYRRFETGYQLPAVYTRAARLPVVGIDWYRAAKYCNWLSKEEGVPEGQWCYEIKGNEIRLRADYLRRAGYRLPTEAEVEYATRAGAVTSRYFGEGEALLPKYAWYQKNSREMTWPVGGLKPNDLGLFDAHGNVYTWCQESFKPYPAGKGAGVTEDQEDGLMVDSAGGRGYRGGSFLYPASFARSAYRNYGVPALQDLGNGFRPARTLPPGPCAALPPSPEGGRK